MDLNQCAGKVHSVLFRGGVTSENESESCSVVSESLPPRGLYSPWNSPGQNTGVGSLSLFQGIFPTQGLNPGLCLHCRQILYQVNHQGMGFLTRYDGEFREPLVQRQRSLTPCVWPGRSRHCSRIMGGTRASRGI